MPAFTVTCGGGGDHEYHEVVIVSPDNETPEVLADSITTWPLADAELSNVTVPTAAAPPTNCAGDTVTVDTIGDGVTVNIADVWKSSTVAVIVIFVGVVTVLVLISKVYEVLLTRLRFLRSVAMLLGVAENRTTLLPEPITSLFKVTLPNEESPFTTAAGDIVSEIAGSGVGLTVN